MEAKEIKQITRGTFFFLSFCRCLLFSILQAKTNQTLASFVPPGWKLLWREQKSPDTNIAPQICISALLSRLSLSFAKNLLYLKSRPRFIFGVTPL